MKKEFKVGETVLIEAKITSVQRRTLGIRSISGQTYYPHICDVKHAEPEFIPREMLCWDFDEMTAIKREVIGTFYSQYLTKADDVFISYKNAKEIQKELENGKCYKSKSGSIFYVIDYKKGSVFGFDKNEYYHHKQSCSTGLEFEEYPLESFKTLLIAEAEKRGFKSGVWVDRKGFHDDLVPRIKILIDDKINFEFKNNDFRINAGHTLIFKNGIFAKIIE